MAETSSDVYVEDEIDLREYSLVLIRNWRLIAAVTFVAAAFALIVSLLLTPIYEATALVALAGSRYQLQFDPRFEAVPFDPPESNTLSAIATSDEVMQLVLDEVRGDLEPEEVDLDAFKETVEVKVPPNSQILELTARGSSPVVASRIANTWGEKFVTSANNVMVGALQEQTFYLSRVILADDQLRKADDALITFEAGNLMEIWRAQLAATQSLLNTYLDQKNTFRLLLPNIVDLQRQIELLPEEEPIGLADELASLALQHIALDASPNIPIQLQLAEGTSLSGKTAGEHLSYLANLQISVRQRMERLDTEFGDLRKEILKLQTNLEDTESKRRALIFDRDMASQTLVALSNKLEEANLEAEKPQGEVRMASQAGVPTQPTSPRILLNTVVAAALGAMLGVFLVFFRAWWSPAPDAKPEAEQASKLSQGLAADN